MWWCLSPAVEALGCSRKEKNCLLLGSQVLQIVRIQATCTGFYIASFLRCSSGGGREGKATLKYQDLDKFGKTDSVPLKSNGNLRNVLGSLTQLMGCSTYRSRCWVVKWNGRERGLGASVLVGNCLCGALGRAQRQEG